MVDRHEGLARSQGDCLCEGEASQQAADQTRSGGGRNEVDSSKRRAGLGYGLTGDRRDTFDMCAGGDFGYDTAIGAVLVQLRANHVCQDLALGGAVAADDGNGGFVATRLDPECEYWAVSRRECGWAGWHHGSFCMRLPRLPIRAAEGQYGCCIWCVYTFGMGRMPALGPNSTCFSQGKTTTMIRIGTRGSILALAQAKDVAKRLKASWRLEDEDVSIVEIRTSGDRIQDRPLSEVGGKGLFTKEIEQALFDKRIDVAVHSLKDVETELPAGTELVAVLEREDVHEVFISRKYGSLSEMPAGARLGTSSLRRRSQAKVANPGIELVDFRGNVQTRLEKLAAGVADATFLAHAGLNRLGYWEDYFHVVHVDDMLPAVAQGAVALQIRSDDEQARRLCETLDHLATALCVHAERAFLRRLDGSCRTPIAGLGELTDVGCFRFRGEILSIDGTKCVKAERIGSNAKAKELATAAGEELLEAAGDDFY